MANTQARTDEQIIDALRLAGVPKAYRRSDVGLSKTCGAIGKRLHDFILADQHHGLFSGGVLEVEGNTVDHHKAFYLFVRAMILRNLAAAVVFAEDLIPSRITEEVERTMSEYSVIAIEGMTPHGCNPFGTSASTVEWRLSRWIDSGRGMVLLTDGQISNCELWSKRFRALLAEKSIKY